MYIYTTTPFVTKIPSASFGHTKRLAYIRQTLRTWPYPTHLGKQPAVFWKFVPKIRTSGAVLITQLLKNTRSLRFRLRRSSSWWSSHCETASNTLTPSRIIEDLKDVLSSAPTPAVLTRTSAASTKFFSFKAEG